MPTGWRIVKARRASTAFQGEGARLFGGRWNTRGTRMIYTSGTASLAVLEMLVHLRSSAPLGSYVLFAARFDEALVTVLDRARLPEGWRAYPAPAACQALGDEWARAARSAVLEVPSAVVEQERNYLLNPGHPDFGKIEVGAPQPFRFDARLATARR